jgi:hypothetical protein
MSINDKKPSTICNTCYTELMRWHDFRELAQTSDEYLSDLILKPDSKQIPIERKEKLTVRPIDIKKLLSTGTILKTPVLQIKRLDADCIRTKRLIISKKSNVKKTSTLIDLKIEYVTVKDEVRLENIKTLENTNNHTTGKKRKSTEIKIASLVKRERFETK